MNLNYDEFVRAKRLYDRAPSGTTDMSLLNLVNKAINNTEEEEEDPVIRDNRNKEFLTVCGKYEKGGKGANLTKAQSLYNSMNSIDIEYTDEDGWTALFHACGEDELSIVKFLIEECYANIDKQSPEDDTTALWNSAFNGCSDVVNYLLLVGANERIKGKADNHPLCLPSMAARRNRKPGIADLIDLETSLRENDPERLKKQISREMTLVEWRESIRKNLKQKSQI